MNSDRPRNDFRTFSSLNTTHGPNPQLLKGLVSSRRASFFLMSSMNYHTTSEYVDQSMN